MASVQWTHFDVCLYPLAISKTGLKLGDSLNLRLVSSTITPQMEQQPFL